ncbi:MAG: phosphate/phosphite/phosphonate ABC transporter substrate-binding protein, partial [Casimicrobiaceae bacterium]
MLLIRSIVAAALALGIMGFAATANAADACKSRGELDTMYCDSNSDMVADAPADPKKWKNPSTIVFTYTPVEDPAVYESVFKPFTTHLSSCLNKKVVFYQVQSNASEIEAMRSGRLHVGGFSTGPTAFAVNIAGAVPFAVKGDASGFQGYNLILIVKASSPYQKITDLKDKKVAHTSPSSNSGNLAPRALFPGLGLTPDKDYKVIFSGKHDQSVMGVNSGDYDA